MRDLTGETIGRYRLVEVIGRGSTAVVYKAYQASLDRYVAIKLLPTDLASADAVAQFQREATAIARLRHPNILTIHDFGEHEGMAYIAMEYVPGGTLRDRLDRPLDLVRATNLVSQAAAALDYAHREGIVHRDIKPGNLLMLQNDWLLVSDFGLARLKEARPGLTKAGLGVGTVEYMAPEQAQGLETDGRADIYALGVVLFELLTGQLPYNADIPVAVVLKQLNEPVPSARALNSALPAEIDPILEKAMAKAPEERYATAGELVADLRQVAASGRRQRTRAAWSRGDGKTKTTRSAAVGAAAPPPQTPTRAARPAPRPARPGRWERRALLALTALVVLLTALGAGFWWRGSAQGQTASPTAIPIAAKMPDLTGRGAFYQPTGRMAFIKRIPGRNLQLAISELPRLDQAQTADLGANIQDVNGLDWSRDGRSLVFAGETSEGHSDLYVVDLPLGSRLPTKISEVGDANGPAWSPEAGVERIAFHATVSGKNGPGSKEEIYVVERLAGGTWSPPRVVTSMPEQRQVRLPAWSPDGQQIAFSAGNDSTQREIYVAPFAPNGPQPGRPLTRNGQGNFGPAWSPDGKRIAYYSDVGRQRDHEEIWVMDADGNNARQLTRSAPDRWNAFPVWSPGPSGDWIAFVGGAYRDAVTFTGEILTMAADGSHQVVTRASEVHYWRVSWAREAGG